MEIKNISFIEKQKKINMIIKAEMEADLDLLKHMDDKINKWTGKWNIPYKNVQTLVKKSKGVCQKNTGQL